MNKILVSLAVLAAAAPAGAFAQAGGGGGGGGFGGGGFGGGGAPPGGAPRSGPRGAPGEVEGLTVRGQSQGFRSSIDRRSYNVVDDLQTATGSIGDALRNVPSVQVDVEGNVSLRGDNVTILVDGRPSALFSGDQAAAIQTFPADQIERVEVITNPSAALSPEGSGGIINLVTKQTFRAGYSGSVRANAGTQGQWNGGVSAAYQDGKLVASVAANLRDETRKTETLDQRTRINTTTGQGADSLQKSTSRNTSDNAFIRAGVDYDLTSTLRLGAEASYRKSTSDSTAYDHTENENAQGVLSQIVDRVTLADQSSESADVEASFRKRFSGDEHELTGEVSHETNDDSRRRQITNTVSLPPRADLLEDIRYAGDLAQTQVRLDYNRPMPGESRLKTGYLLDLDDNHYDNVGRRGGFPWALTVDPTLTYVYDFRQEVHAFYATYEKPFGDWTVLGGVRAEQAKVDVAVPTQNVDAENDYFKVYPSLHLAYDVSEMQRISASYSVRIQRPRADDLNPFIIYIDPFNYRQGNPDLLPQISHSYELGWQYRRSGVYYLATLYYRRSVDGISDVTRDTGNGVFLTTRENLDSSKSGGLELVANGRLTSKLTYNVSGNVNWNEIDASSVGLSANRSAFSFGGRANLNWQVTSKDMIQVNGFANGKRLNAQGYQKGFGMLNLGYRRKLNDRLSLVTTVQDVLGTARQTTVFDTPTLIGTTRRDPNQRNVFIGLTWAFGAVQRQQRDQGFEFDNAAGNE